VLRYNVEYDSNWDAVASGEAMAHLRLDATINGWLLPNSRKAFVVYLIHEVALAQTLAEAVGVLWIVVVVLYTQRIRPAKT